MLAVSLARALPSRALETKPFPRIALLITSPRKPTRWFNGTRVDMHKRSGRWQMPVLAMTRLITSGI